MKRTKKIFDFGLFTEGLRQTRGLALTFTFIVNLISVLLPSGIAVIYEDSGADFGRLAINNVPNFLHLYLVFIILAPILTYKLFHFLNKRNACDYYHSIPQKRITIYISYILSILFWIIVSIIATALITLVTYGIFSQYFDVSLLAIISLLKFCVAIFICSMLITAGIALGCAISGRMVFSIILSFIFLVFPRLLVVLFTFTVTAMSPILAVKPTLFFLEYNTNLLYASVFSANESFISLVPMIYTILTALLYFIIAGVYFIKRDSELAGRVSHGTILHKLSTQLISLPATFVTFCCILFIITNIEFINIDTFYMLFTIVSFIMQAEIFGLVVLILYVLLVSGKLNKFRQFLAPIATYFIAQIILFVLTIGVYYAETLYITNPDNIDYLVICDYAPGYSFYNECFEQYKVKNEKLNKYVAQSLNNTVNDYLFGKSDDSDYDLFGYNLEFSNQTSVTVGINTGFTTKYRKISMHLGEFSEYSQYHATLNGEFHNNLFRTLPKYNTETMELSDPNDLSEDELYKLYKMLDEELDDVDANAWLSSMDSYGDEYITVSFRGLWSDNTDDIPITDLTPKTLKAYREMVAAKK